MLATTEPPVIPQLRDRVTDGGHSPVKTLKKKLGLWSRQTPAWTPGVCLWMHLVNGMGDSLSLGQPTPGVVKQDKSSGGSVDTTKTRSDPQRVRMSSGERPIGQLWPRSVGPALGPARVPSLS